MKQVKVIFSVETVQEVPDDWDEEMVEFYYGGGSSWCADNLVDDLIGRRERGSCNCDIITGRYAGEATKEDLERYRRSSCDQ